MPSYDFSDTVVFVTGAGRGQGRSHAVQYAEHGADVVVTDICETLSSPHYEFSNREDLEETASLVREHDRESLALEVDVRDEADVKAAVDTAIEKFGRIDVLANNAGMMTMGGLLDIEETTWNETVDTVLKGVWICSKHVGAHMVERGEGGKIVNTGSASAIVGFPHMGHYAAAKHGVMGLTKTLALELAEHDINVNAVCPSAVETMVTSGIIDAHGDEAISTITDIAGPANVMTWAQSGEEELLSVNDVTEAYLWLSSDAARYVTGTAIVIDAGFTAK